MLYLDPTYYLFVLPGLALALFAQALIWINYSKYSAVSADSHLTGVEAAQKVLKGEGFDVALQLAPGRLNDFYDPIRDVVNLSADNQQSESVANIAVVAHEFGHVQQKYDAALLFRIRTGMVPAVNISSTLGYILFIVGLFLSASGLVTIGLILFSLTTLFVLITVPIEFDASRRGMELIKKYNLIAEEKLGGARAVLNATALTYVAALIQSLGQLLYFISIANRRR